MSLRSRLTGEVECITDDVFTGAFGLVFSGFLAMGGLWKESVILLIVAGVLATISLIVWVFGYYKYRAYRKAYSSEEYV